LPLDELSFKFGINMETTESLPQEVFWEEDSFGFIKPEEFKSLGIDAADIPPGTFAARKHPSQIPSRFGGNAYGVGFFEVYDRLNPKDIQLLQSITSEDPDYIRKYSREINRIYKNIGLLKRVSSRGRPYYLIPVHLVLSSLSNIRSKAEEISKIIDFHRKKYLKESHKIGLLTHADDLILNDLSLRFKEHQFIVLDSFERLRHTDEPLDLVILPRDIYQILSMEKFIPRSWEISKRQLENYVYYMLGKVYNLLKPDGEIFIIANYYALKTHQTIKILFHGEQEQKNFILFSHVFKTKKKYQPKGRSFQVNKFDFQGYLTAPYVEKEVFDRLLGDRDPEKMSLAEINNLPYLNFPLEDEFAYDQDKTWSKFLSVHFNKIFLKPLLPDPIKKGWRKRFSTGSYSPDYMLIYLGQKKPIQSTLGELTDDVLQSRLSGCPLPLLADYRDSFDYLIRTIDVLRKIKSGSYAGLPELFMERLREPLENKKRRYSGLNDVLRLKSKVNRLKRIKDRLNPDRIEGARTRVLKNLEALSLFGFSYGELREIFLIVVGHTPMGRILSGKMNEKSLKPVSDLARTYDPLQALNLLRFCRLMSMAETAASKGADLNQEELAELFDLYESMVRVVTTRDMDWDRLLDERISSMGGIHNKIIGKILKMMNLFQFLGNWSELSGKGSMEKESLADYDEERLAKIDNVIELKRIIEQFENMYLKDDPLQLSIFYRKFLNLEFHGTVHLFERVNGTLVFLLLWITVNVVRGDIINFNGILGDLSPEENIDDYLNKVEGEAKAINISYLDLVTLKRLSEQLYENDTTFILGTGFQLRVNKRTQAIDITYIDMDENIERLHSLVQKFTGSRISEIPIEDLEKLEGLFANLESFYRSHIRLISYDYSGLKLPGRQKEWFEKATNLREFLRTNFIRVIFQPENVYSDLDLLFRHSPSLLHFVLPEFMALRDLHLPGKMYLKSPLIEHILASTSKMQALIRRDREAFQDIQSLHKLAQREFGPMAAGIVGLNEAQIEMLENIVARLRENRSLFDALIKSFIFRDLGMMPEFREKYKEEINPADHAQAGALFLEKEKIVQRYSADKKTHQYLVFLVKYHNLFHHMIRGEFSLYAIQDVVDLKDKDLFDAFFVGSFIMFSAMREDLIMEDLARSLFQFRNLCHRVIDGITTPEDHLREIHASKGHLFYALDAFRREGLPKEVAPVRYLESYEWKESERENYIQAGKMIYALERIFRLRGIRYVEFPDLANHMVKVPLRYIYKKRNYYGIGYATFERELFEALRIYNGLQTLSERARHFIFEDLVTDEVRIFGFENVSVFLSYENLIKLLFISLLGARKFKKENGGPVSLNFLDLVEKIEKRYEAVNDTLSNISVEKLWQGTPPITHLFKAKTGLILRKVEALNTLSIDFVDRINIGQKISYMKTIADLDQLKNYYHYSLQSLRRTPFYTDDYELELERAFEYRLREITDLMLDQAKKQMALLKDFREIHNLFTDLMDRSLDIGFSDEQKHRLNDIYELRKDNLRREKLKEIDHFLETISDIHELKDYWDGIKWYLLNNRLFSGKEFETLIAKKFDEAEARMDER
jgi:hypothetical protein